jgi:cytochrome P450
MISVEIANDITDPFAYANWDVSHKALAELRRNAPVAMVQPDGYDPFWVITRYDDVQAVETKTDLFLHGPRSHILLTRAELEQNRKLTGGSSLSRSIARMDNPEHIGYRRITHGAFIPQNVRRLEEQIRALANEYIDRMFELGEECDFAKDVAFMFPLRVIMELLGVPPEDAPLILKLTQELFAPTDPELSRAKAQQSPEEMAKSKYEVVREMHDYFAVITDARRRQPSEDLASVIANGKINGAELGHHETLSYYGAIATAGHDTTSSSLASAGWVLAEHPDLLQRLRDDPSLVPSMVEESLRWETPVKHFMRTAASDVEIGGQKIRQGDWLMVSFPSANRDESKFIEPFQFDISRKPNRHLGFGFGSHVCLGQHLARLEMKIFLEELLPRLKTLDLAGDPKRAAANLVCGPKTVPVRYRAA